MSFTYAQLKTAIQDYAENDETSFVNNLDIFIKNTEERILKNVQLSLFRKNASGTMTNANQYLACPSDFLAPLSLSFVDSSSNKVFLELKDPDFIQTVNPNSATTGSPKYYGVYDVDNFVIGPTPNSSYTVQLHYFYRPTSITESGDGTSWLGTNAELALLYGSLVEAYTFLKGEPDLMNLYNSRFQESLQWLKNLGEGLQTRDQYRYDRLRRDTA